MVRSAEAALGTGWLGRAEVRQKGLVGTRRLLVMWVGTEERRVPGAEDVWAAVLQLGDSRVLPR